MVSKMPMDPPTPEMIFFGMPGRVRRYPATTIELFDKVHVDNGLWMTNWNFIA
jgi:hypothetical protein